MGNIAIGGQNLLALSTPTYAGGSWALPLSNLTSRRRSDVARSTDATSANTKFTMDWGSAKTARVLVLLGHNLSSAATIRWKRGTTLGAGDVYDSTAVSAWRFTPLTYDGRVWGVWVVQPSATAARYESIEIVDTGNADGYVEVAHPWIGDVFVPAINAQLGLKSTMRDLGSKERTEGGTPVVISRQRLQGETFVLADLTSTEARTVRQIQHWAGTTEEVLYSPDIDDPVVTQADGFVGTFDDLGAIEYAQLARRGVPISLTRD